MAGGLRAAMTSNPREPSHERQARWYALGAIALWACLAGLGLLLQHVPPFLLTGLSLLVGSCLSLPALLRNPRALRLPLSTLALGVYGLFGFHFLLFIALRHAPPVEANLVNYLWPLLMVILAPCFMPALRLKAVHVLAALMGLAGAALAILGPAASTSTASTAGWFWGYLPALGSAIIWATYSLGTQRVQPFATSAIGLFGAVSGALSLLCHAALEPAVSLSLRDGLLIVLMGLGPLGAAFFLWDKALKLGDPRQIGILSYLTPLGSTALLMLVSGSAMSWTIAAAALLIVAASVIGARSMKSSSP